MSDKKFYVYVHRYASGPKEGQVFYVGKGSGDRLNETKCRNMHWHNISRKYGFTAILVRNLMTECCSFTLEKMLIFFYGRENLVNQTDGGEGASGAIRSQDTREKLRLANTGKTSPNKGKSLSKFHIENLRKSAIGKTVSDETKAKLSVKFSGEGNPFYGRTHSAETRRKIRYARIGVIATEEAKAKMRERPVRSGRDAPAYSNSIHEFKHESGVVFHGTQYDLYTKYGLTQSNVSALVRGVQNTCKGWKIVNDTSTSTGS